jgi:hypothetical protein
MSLTSRFADRAWYRLTAHFFVGLFDFGVLSEAGSDAFKRVMIGIIAAMLTFGLLFARILMSAAGSHEGSSEAARQSARSGVRQALNPLLRRETSARER